MYTVYKITNLINKKSYIGSSIRVEKRWQQHKNSAFNENSQKYNYPLYKAFRKYGLENFSFEILCDDFSSLEEMRNYEKDMIIFYDSYNKGYNQTYETFPNQIGVSNAVKYVQQISQKCAKVDINNNIIEMYSSYHDAARKNGYNEDAASAIRLVCKGKTHSYNGNIFKDIDENGHIKNIVYQTSARRKKIYSLNVLTLEEKYYDSILQTSQITGIDRRRIHECITGSQRYSIIHDLIFREINEYGDIIEVPNSPTIDEKLKEFNEKHPLINGERHNIKEWCKIYNISTASFYTRRRAGMDVIEAITTPKRR